MSGPSFFDTFRGWHSVRGPSLPIPLQGFDEFNGCIRLRCGDIRILEVQVRDDCTITVVLVTTTEGFPMGTLKQIRMSNPDGATAACEQLERWISDELAHATAIAMTGRRGPGDAQAVLLRADDPIDDYRLAVALRD
ncbi:hypothetical protein [Falsiroseomonas sp.]|uniref:hypothetical protein n=1 Tax=Falsiroseomonas sp. TaxID=2870721 RepID=UPI002734BFC4|nr:hypothetical protein [Falsiroseomonas sp.]MDP3416119.1 hypothetical protein [Falsiroseomonas sp.]